MSDLLLTQSACRLSGKWPPEQDHPGDEAKEKVGRCCLNKVDLAHNGRHQGVGNEMGIVFDCGSDGVGRCVRWCVLWATMKVR